MAWEWSGNEPGELSELVGLKHGLGIGPELDPGGLWNGSGLSTGLGNWPGT